MGPSGWHKRCARKDGEKARVARPVPTGTGGIAACSLAAESGRFAGVSLLHQGRVSARLAGSQPSKVRCEVPAGEWVNRAMKARRQPARQVVNDFLIYRIDSYVSNRAVSLDLKIGRYGLLKDREFFKNHSCKRLIYLDFWLFSLESGLLVRKLNVSALKKRPWRMKKAPRCAWHGGA